MPPFRHKRPVRETVGHCARHGPVAVHAGIEAEKALVKGSGERKHDRSADIAEHAGHGGKEGQKRIRTSFRVKAHPGKRHRSTHYGNQNSREIIQIVLLTRNRRGNNPGGVDRLGCRQSVKIDLAHGCSHLFRVRDVGVKALAHLRSQFGPERRTYRTARVTNRARRLARYRAKCSPDTPATRNKIDTSLPSQVEEVSSG